MEMLSPAGSMDALKAAVAAGADAVYLGYTAFSARAGAGNFDEPQLREAVRLCHLRGVRVHVALNTLIKDSELPEVLQVLRILSGAGVDALLVQDLGVLRMVRRRFPGMTAHASTQMAIHNATGARWCLSQGIRRVVLARECSLPEIAECCRLPVEIEVFVHGAQCVAVSGECLFSSMLGERSGNRGRCAQPCRLCYTAAGKEGTWLSPRDLCLRDDLPALFEAGVASLKIEGRLKSPAYVAGVTRAYARAARAAEQGRFREMDEAEGQELAQLFNRGFMRGHAFGVEDAGLISPEGNAHRGVAIGRVARTEKGRAAARLAQPLHTGDELKLPGTKEPIYLTWREPDAKAGDTVFLPCTRDNPLQAGEEVIRLSDAALTKRLESLPLPMIPARAELIAVPGQPLSLTVTAGKCSVRREGAYVEAARTAAVTEESLFRQLQKTGDTAFQLTHAEIRTENAFVPLSAVNALRREAFSALEEALLARTEKKAEEEEGDLTPRLPSAPAPNLFLFREPGQLALMPEGFLPVWQPEDWRNAALEAGLDQLPDGVWLHLPVACEETTLQGLCKFTARHREKLGGVLLGSVGQLGIKWPVPMAAGPGVPVMNRLAASLLLEEGCRFVTASQELSGRERKALSAGSPPVAVWAYGRAQMMLLHHCPARTALGLTEGHRQCSLCDRRDKNSLRGMTLTDRKHIEFPLARQRLPEGCLVQLLNSVPTDLRGQVAAEGWPMLISLTDEKEWPRAEQITTGHWRRPVE